MHGARCTLPEPAHCTVFTQHNYVIFIITIKLMLHFLCIDRMKSISSSSVFLSNLKTHLYNRHFNDIMGFKVFLDFLFIGIVFFHIW